MERLQRAALNLSIVKELEANGSWCGETHIQKASYLLKLLLQVPLDYQFVLYKYGPYSFDLSGDLTAMRAEALLRLVPRQLPYGPALLPGKASEEVLTLYPKTIARYNAPIKFVAARLGGMGVAELERVSTALYVTRESGAPSDAEARAYRITQLKPHVTLADARTAISTMDAYIAEAQPLLVEPAPV